MSLAGTLNKLRKSDSFEEAFIQAIKCKVKAVGGQPRSISKTYKPSWMHNCKRKQFFLFRDYPADGAKSVNPELWFMGKSGEKDHRTIQELLWDMSEWGVEMLSPAKQIERIQELGVNTEVHHRQREDDIYELAFYNKDLNISGKCDGLLTFRNKLVIFEYKNEDYFKFTKRVTADANHKIQGSAYSLCLDIGYVLFLYHDRNYKVLKAFLVPISEEDRQSVVQYIQDCNLFIKNNYLPPIELDKCKWCIYTGACKTAGPEGRQL